MCISLSKGPHRNVYAMIRVTDVHGIRSTLPKWREISYRRGRENIDHCAKNFAIILRQRTMELFVLKTQNSCLAVASRNVHTVFVAFESVVDF